MSADWHLAGKTAAGFLVAAMALAGCKTKSAPSPDSTRPAPATGASDAPSASAPLQEAKPAPTMVLKPVAVDTKEPLSLYSVDGAILVAEPRRVGRLVGDGVEWVGKIPEGGGALGRHYIYSVRGKWPDGVDVFYQNENGRGPEPTYYPMTGKGKMQIFGEGGFGAYIVGVTEVGESSLLISWDTMANVRVWTARGPALPHKLQTPRQAECKPDEVTTASWQPPPPAIVPSALASTRDGIVVTVGSLCEKRPPAAEVFDKAGISHIVDLSQWYPSQEYESTSILRGAGNELFVLHGRSNPILRFADGVFKPLPRLDSPWKNAVVSQQGYLYVNAGETILRYEDETWKPVVRLAWPIRFGGMAVDGGTIWVESASVLSKLAEGPAVTYRDGCPTPFVYLYDVSPLNDAKFTYPATQKALATFPGIESLSLEEFTESGVKRLGVSVVSREQGDAIIAHIKANMKDEDPRLLCYAPSSARKIALKSKQRKK